MPPKRDLIGLKFGRLLVVEDSGLRRNNKVLWRCLCDCGSERLVPAANLTRGITQSCGCFQRDLLSERNLSDLSGRRFGRLEVVSRVHRVTSGRHALWSCRCDCGNYVDVSSNSLGTGNTKSCGCLRTETSESRSTDISEVRYGHLVAITPCHRRAGSQNVMIWRFRCDCGRVVELPKHRVVSGNTSSCGCTSRVDYDGLRFRSRWEAYWYIAAKVRNLQIEYETVTLDVIVDGRLRKYTPDFYVNATNEYFEIKGRPRERGMMKLSAAQRDGSNIHLVTRQELEEWCGTSVGRMARACASGGMDAVRKLIEHSLL